MDTCKSDLINHLEFQENLSLYTAISRKVVGKSARDNPERHSGWFWSEAAGYGLELLYNVTCNQSTSSPV